MRKVFLFVLLLVLGLALCGQEVELRCGPESLAVYAGEKVMLRVQVKNRSSYNLDSGENFFLTYHVFGTSGQLLRFESQRFPLPQAVAKLSNAAFSLPVFFDMEPGSYRVQIDLVKEGEFWGEKKGWRACLLKVRIKPLWSEDFRKQFLPTFYRSGNLVLDREQYLLRLTLKNAELSGQNGLFGFGAGSTYPALWIRDAATFLHLARCYYPWRALAAMVERFLRTQKPDGEIVDWIDEAGRVGKNTTETDQESSLVLAARQIALGNPAWLRQQIRGRPVLERLDQALTWVWKNRRNPATGLLFSGFTADWGDVENSYADQRALQWSDKSTAVLGIYTQAKFIQAVAGLVEMARFLHETSLADLWSGRLDFLKQKTRQMLYLPDKGYFLIHRVPGQEQRYDWEKEILAVGGNAEALNAGLLQREEIARFLNVLETKKKQYGLATPSFTLLPPFPENFFPHHLLRRSWSYQNGGAWDWIGGRLVQALYGQGLAAQAEKYLLQMCANHQQQMTLFEWQDRQGKGQGAMFYAGAAGVIGEAILKGCLGLDEDFYSVRLDLAAAPFSFLRLQRRETAFTVSGEKEREVLVQRSAKKLCIFRSAKKIICLAKPSRTKIRDE